VAEEALGEEAGGKQFLKSSRRREDPDDLIEWLSGVPA
jgi:hypothetical protein